MLHIEEYVGIIIGARQTRRTRALANPDQPRGTLFHELKRHIEAHDRAVDDVRIVSAIDTGQADDTHQPVRHWYYVVYEA